MAYYDIGFGSVKELMEKMDADLDFDVSPEEAEELANPFKNQILQKFDFKWTKEEQAYLNIVKASADAVLVAIFADIMGAIDNLYEQARLIKRSETGRPLKDSDGRPVWETDKYGNIVEDWRSVETADIENAVISLLSIKMDVSSRVDDLYLEALYARNSYKDVYNDKYHGILAGTVADRTAAAERANRRERYKAFSRFWLWYKANNLKKEIENMIRVLEIMRGWRNWGPKS